MNARKRGRRRPSVDTGIGSRLLRRLQVTFAVRADPRSDAIRAGTLAVLVGTVFVLLGSAPQFRLAEWLAESPFNPDLALRALSHGWFESARTVPVTIVDIDEETHRGWGAPLTTPRDQLTRLLQVVTQVDPAAVIVDIDLSEGQAAGVVGAAGSLELREFLARYSGAAPIILPKRVEQAPDGMRRLTVSPFDDVLKMNSRLVWAHASFETGGGGAVRSWQHWLQVCTPSGAEWLPAVATSLAANLSTLPPGLSRPEPPAVAERSCRVASASAGDAERLLIGPRLTGDTRSAPRPDAQAISAALLLDPQIARDDSSLFRGRVVFIGSTHQSAGDFWLTASGVLPGVELLANTVRYSPLQGESSGWLANLAYRAVTLLLFALFVVAEWRLRGFGAVVAITVGVLATVAALLALFDNLIVFDALEAAILLALAYKALQVVFKSIEEFKERRPRFPAGPLGWLRALGAGWRREHEPHGQGD